MTSLDSTVRRLGALVLLLSAGCGSDDEAEKREPKGCSVAEQSGCEAGQACEEVVGGEPACFAPIDMRGRVFDTATSAGVKGARVVARDANDVAVSGVAISTDDGSYSLTVPVPRAGDGKPSATSYTLRADAAGYLTFPKAPRVALPVDVATATGNPLVVQNAATDIGLIALPDAGGLGFVTGKVLSEQPGGTLVVAGSVTGVADRDGAYAVYNVAAGSVEVRGYATGVDLETKTAEVTAGAETAGVDLAVISDATATVSGTIQLVNAGGTSTTSVILVVEDTFVPDAARGEAPPGLRAANVSGAWSIPNVPTGNYVVLAAFENDGLVRDPDTSIGGTDIQHISVAGGNTAVEGFKVTGALAVLSPGANGAEPVSGTPRFEWEDDSSEDLYQLDVFDAFGVLVWETEGAFDPGGSKPVVVDYQGPALTKGMFYQFRATSIKDGVPISRTEDLKGVFVFE